MMRKSAYVFIAIVFFWAGFVSSISFMEAWLKFQAPGITLPLGLSIGKNVFTALNHVEWALLFGGIVSFSSAKLFRYRLLVLFFSLVAGILFIQTFFLLPELVERANRIIEGQTVEKSMVHLVFGIVEVLKVFSLVLLGFLGLNKTQNIRI